MSNVHNLWQIFIVTDTNQSIPVTIDPKESVAELFKKFRETQKAFRKEKRLSLLVVDGPELEEKDQTPLADHECLRDKCTIHLIVHVDGGVWPTEIEIRTQNRCPSYIPSLAGRITNDIPDIMGLDDENPRVKMPCGHAIAPTSLALYCYKEIDDGASEIICPGSNCDAVWPFKFIIDAACLSPNETNEFELKMISNKLSHQSNEIKMCPGCKNLCRRLNKDETRMRCRNCTSVKGRNFDFCWSCLEEWQTSSIAVWCGNPKCGDHSALLECLETCDTKTLNGVECPTRRACPECLTVIEHTEKCKHMKCPSKRCKYEFCFICLQNYPCETGAHKPCTLAPRQDSTSFRPPPPPPTSPSDCSIL